MNKALKEVLGYGKPVPVEDNYTYTINNFEAIEKLALESLDAYTEETFKTRVLVECQNNTNKNDKYLEIYEASFKPHGSWGLSTEVHSNEHGRFMLWLRFLEDYEG